MSGRELGAVCPSCSEDTLPGLLPAGAVPSRATAARLCLSGGWSRAAEHQWYPSFVTSAEWDYRVSPKWASPKEGKDTWGCLGCFWWVQAPVCLPLHHQRFPISALIRSHSTPPHMVLHHRPMSKVTSHNLSSLVLSCWFPKSSSVEDALKLLSSQQRMMELVPRFPTPGAGAPPPGH